MSFFAEKKIKDKGMNYLKAPLLAALLLFTNLVQAEEKPVIILNLADNIQRLSLPTNPGVATIKITNFAPALLDQYQVHKVFEQTDIPKFEVPTGIKDVITGVKKAEDDAVVAADAAQRKHRGRDNYTDHCTNLKNENQTFGNIERESDVPAGIQTLQEMIAKAKNDNCSEEVEHANKIILGTVISFDVTIETGYKMSLEVLKVLPGSDPEVLKKLAVTSNKESRWITTYGVGFAQDKSRTYYSEKNGAEGANNYIVREGENRNSWTYSAQILFTLPINTVTNDIEYGVTGGLGASEENVSALMGVSLIFLKNLVLTAGVSMQEQTILKSQFKVGQSAGDTPLDSTLLSDKTYKPTGIIVLSFRF